jgi:hypothetical protein
MQSPRPERRTEGSVVDVLRAPAVAAVAARPHEQASPDPRTPDLPADERLSSQLAEPSPRRERLRPVEASIEPRVDRVDPPAIAAPRRVEVRIGTLEIVAPAVPDVEERPRQPEPQAPRRSPGRRRADARGFDDLFLARAHLNR